MSNIYVIVVQILLIRTHTVHYMFTVKKSPFFLPDLLGLSQIVFISLQKYLWYLQSYKYISNNHHELRKMRFCY